MIVFRLFGLLLIVLALMLLGADLVSTLEKNGETVIRSLDQILMLLGADVKPWLQEQLSPQFANVLLVALSWPGWAILGILGTLLAMLSAGHREPRAPLPPQPPANPINR
ncbi:MAG TPA: hypothetical protein VGM72_05165 [Micropepsaceae bacterium]|jgi:hypothetical protein